MKLYWANSLFTAAQRDFNVAWVSKIRTAGYDVVLPQELGANTPSYSPSASEIFIGDTAEMLSCDAVIAVIDDETIDSGVATELGLAYAHDMPVLGVYTDIRRLRLEGAMYKNLYPLGALPERFASTVEDLLAQLITLEQPKEPYRLVEATPDEYAQHVAALEGTYVPTWSVVQELDEQLTEWRTASVIDFGCGPGTTYSAMVNAGFDGRYIGFDVDARAIDHCRRRFPRGVFSDAASDHANQYESLPHPVIVMANFVLHDLTNMEEFVAFVASAPQGSTVFITDMERGDLPSVTQLIEQVTGRAYRLHTDSRLSVARLTSLSQDLELQDVRMIGRRLRVQLSPELLTRHVELFGILNGNDLGIPSARDQAASKAELARRASTYEGALQDERNFVVMTGRRRA